MRVTNARIENVYVHAVSGCIVGVRSTARQRTLIDTVEVLRSGLRAGALHVGELNLQHRLDEVDTRIFGQHAHRSV